VRCSPHLGITDITPTALAISDTYTTTIKAQIILLGHIIVLDLAWQFLAMTDAPDMYVQYSCTGGSYLSTPHLMFRTHCRSLPALFHYFH
jgi:hypothetical protein